MLSSGTNTLPGAPPGSMAGAQKLGSGLSTGSSGIFGGLASLLGGLGSAHAYSGLGDQLGQLQPLLEKYRQMAVGGLSPFQKAGVGALGEYQHALGGMSDPEAYINKIMSGYHASPEAQQLQQQAMKASTQGASASGMLGSGELEKALQQHAEQITGADQHQYLQNILGVGQEHLAGLSQLLGLGAQTGAQMGQFDIGTGQDIATVLAKQAQARAQAEQSKTGGLAGLLGGLGSGASSLASLLPMLM